MEKRDLASNLEFWSARRGDDAPDPARPPRSFRTSRFRRTLSRARLRLPSFALPSFPALRRTSVGPRRTSTGRARPVAAAALIAALTAAWLVAGRHHTPSPERRSSIV